MKYESVPTCLAPFAALFVNVERITPCCVFSPDDGISKDPVEAWNSELFRNFRKLHYNGDVSKLPRECKECINNSFPLRDAYYERLSHVYDELYNSYNKETGEISINMIKELSLGLSNSCNLACITCCKQQSNTYHRNFGDIVNDNVSIDKNLIFKSNNIVDENFNLLENFDHINNNLIHLVLHGGEPTMSLKAYHVIKKMEKKNTEVELFFLANGTLYKFPNGEDVFETLKPFKNVTLIVSLDGFGKKLSYIRHLQTEKKFLKYIITANEKLPHATIKAHFTMSNLSILGMMETIEKVGKLIKDGVVKIDHLSFNSVNYPEIYRPTNLPSDLKYNIVKDIQEFIKNNRDNWPNHLTRSEFQKILKTFYNYNFSEDLWKDFLIKQKKMDERRNFDMMDAFPELKDYV